MDSSIGFWNHLHHLVQPSDFLKEGEFLGKIKNLFNSEEGLISDIREILKEKELLSHSQVQCLIKFHKRLQILKNPLIKEKYKELHTWITENRQSFIDHSMERGEVTEDSLKSSLYYKNWIADQELRKRWEKGEDKKELLKEAFGKGQTAGVSWLLTKGASLEALDSNVCQARYEWLLKRHTDQIANPNMLDYFAVDVGYGYKTANLLVLKEQLKKFKLETCDVQIPSFLPISSFELQEYLLDAVPEIEEQWNLFLNSFDQELKQQFLSQKNDRDASLILLKISEEGVKILEKIQSLIKKRFKEFPYFTLQLDEWLEEQFQNCSGHEFFLIIRSTGMEDTKENSNAGGNDSITFVKPNLKEINRAMAKSLSSYFGYRSITQRLGGGDRTIFSKKRPFIPLLFQHMIAENQEEKTINEREIPRSGILFTCQTNRAKGITLIQTGLGNNEGMVNGAIDFDSYFIDNQLNIRHTVKRKRTRFVNLPSNKGGQKVKEIFNKNEILEMTPALIPAIIRDLKQIANFISALYSDSHSEGMPMDLEYTIKLQEVDKKQAKPIIYLLQARPLVEALPQSPSSFLDLENCQTISAENKVKVQALLYGNSSVRTIKGPKEVIFADNMKGAFEDPMLDPQRIQAIFIREQAPSTSHYSLMLMPKGIPVFVVESPKEYDRIRDMVALSQEKIPVLVDTQRGLVIEKLTEANIHQGLISYPMPSQMSLSILPITLRGMRWKQAINEGDENKAKIAKAYLKVAIPNFHTRIMKLIQECLGKEEFVMISKSDKIQKQSLSSLIELMATKETTQAKRALGLMIKFLYHDLSNHIHQSDEEITSNFIMPNFMVLENMIHLAEKEIIPALEKFPPQSMNRLYYLKSLESLIFQKPNPNTLLSFSYGYGVITIKEVKKGIEEMKREGFKATQMTRDHLFLMLFKRHIWNEETVKIWVDLIKSLDNKEVKTFKEMIEEICKLRMEAHWLNIVFIDLWRKTTEFKQFLNSFKQVWKEGEGHRLLQVEKMLQLQILDQKMEQWKKQQHVAKSIKDFKKFYEDNFQYLANTYQNMDKFCQLAILDHFSYAVDIYDRTIKTVESSPNIPEKDKVKYVAELLEGYFEIMKFSFQLLSKEDEIELMALKEISCEGIPYLQFTFESFIDKLQKGGSYFFGGYNPDKHKHLFKGFEQLVQDAKNYLSTGDQLQARPFFIVEPMIIGSQVDRDYSTHWADRLEEYFMIFHQNMIKIIEHKRSQLGMNKDILPNFAKPFIDLIEASFRTKDFKTSIFGITEEDNKVAVNFNIPLRQHSGFFTLRITPSNPTGEIELSGKLFGANEHHRWDRIAAFVSLLAHQREGVTFINGISPQINYQVETPNGVSFALRIHDHSKIEKLINQMPYIYKVLTTENIAPTEWQSINWEQHDMQCFADAFYGNVNRLDQLSKKGQYKNAARVAQYSLLGLAKKNLIDYTIDCSYNLSGYLGHPDYHFVPYNQENLASFTGLKQAAVLHLIKAFKEGSKEEIEPIIQEILNEPLLQQAFSDELRALRQGVKGLSI